MSEFKFVKLLKATKIKGIEHISLFNNLVT